MSKKHVFNSYFIFSLSVQNYQPSFSRTKMKFFNCK